jgi:hypothetical protein
MTYNLSLIYQIQDFGSGQIQQPRQLYLSPGFAKIAPWWLARRDYFLAKVPGLVSADGATNVYSLNRQAVLVNYLVLCTLYSIQKTNHNRKARFIILDKSCRSAGICNRDKFPFKCELSPVYLDCNLLLVCYNNINSL